jgi:4-hydroxy-tetrahydrodipicolinate reductase
VTVVCAAGATGWTGRPISEAVLAASDLTLGAAVSRSAAGRDLGEAWGQQPNGVTVVSEVSEGLKGVDVLVEYTAPESAMVHAMTAIERGVHVVIGSSGLSVDDYVEIDAAARASGVGVIAAGNFSLTAAMMQAAALLVAPFFTNREIIDLASVAKPDAPSGTSRELAERLAMVAPNELVVAIEDTVGFAEARGADIAGTQVHSLRLPSFVVSTEIVFAETDERLVIRHDAGSTPTPYVAGTLLAVRRVSTHVGLVRGLDTLLLQGR